MAKRNNKSASSNKTKVKKTRMVRQVPDDGALAYKRLLLDPCFAPLPPVPYGGATAGQIQRKRATVQLTQTEACILFHPSLGVFTQQTTTPAVAGNFTPYTTVLGGGGGNPGRAIAGCLSVLWSGSENTRSGMVYCSNIPGSIVWNYLAAANGGAGNTVALNNIAQNMGHGERIPVEKCEINWVPGAGDDEPIPPTAAVSGQASALETLFAKTNFICVYVSGVTTTANTVLNFTAVQEITGYDGSGTNNATPWSIATAVPPKFDWRTVVESLAQKDPSWYINTFKKIGNFAVGLGTSYTTMGLPGALGYLVDKMSNQNGSNMRGKQYARTA